MSQPATNTPSGSETPDISSSVDNTQSDTDSSASATSSNSSSGSRASPSDDSSSSSSDSSESTATRTATSTESSESSRPTSTVTWTSSTTDEESETTESTSTSTSTSSSTSTESSETTSSSSSETTDTKSSTTSDPKTTHRTSVVSDVSSTSSKVPAFDATGLPSSGKHEADKGGLSTGTIIGISLAGFAVIGVLLVVLGTFLKYRRRKAIEKRTAHLKRASEIWDFADSGTDIDKANEKAATNKPGEGYPFSGSGGHNRSDSMTSAASGAGSFRSEVAPVRPMHPPGQYAVPFHRPPQPMGGGWAARLSRAFVNTRPPPPSPTTLPVHANLVGQSAIGQGGEYFSDARVAPPMLERQDSFGARAAAAPAPRNQFFPPPPPNKNGFHMGVSPPSEAGSMHPLGVTPTPPLALPGSK